MVLFNRGTELTTLFSTKQDTRTNLFFTPEGGVSLPFSVTRSTTEGGWELTIEGTSGTEVLIKNLSATTIHTIVLPSASYTFDIRTTPLIYYENQDIIVVHNNDALLVSLSYQQDAEGHNIGIQDISVSLVPSGLDADITATILYNFDSASTVYWGVPQLVDLSVSNFVGGTGDYEITFTNVTYLNPDTYNITTQVFGSNILFSVFDGSGVQVDGQIVSIPLPASEVFQGFTMVFTENVGIGTEFDPTTTTSFTLTSTLASGTLTKNELRTGGITDATTISQPFTSTTERFPPQDPILLTKVTTGLTPIPVLYNRKALATSYNSTENTYSEPKFEQTFNYDVGDTHLSFNSISPSYNPSFNRITVSPGVVTTKGFYWHDIVTFTLEFEYNSTKMVYDPTNLSNPYGYTLVVNDNYGGSTTLDRKMRVVGQRVNGYAGQVLGIVGLPFIINTDITYNVDLADPVITCVNSSSLAFLDEQSTILSSTSATWNGITDFVATTSSIEIIKTAGYPPTATQPWSYSINGGAAVSVPITQTLVSGLSLSYGDDIEVFQPISGSSIAKLLTPPSFTHSLDPSTFELTITTTNVTLPYTADFVLGGSTVYSYTTSTNPYVFDVRAVGGNLLGSVYTVNISTATDTVDLSYPTDGDGTTLGGQTITGFDATFTSSFDYDITYTSLDYAAGSTLYHDEVAYGGTASKAALISSGVTTTNNTFEWDAVNDIDPTNFGFSSSFGVEREHPKLTDRDIAGVLYDSGVNRYSPLYTTTKTLDVGQAFTDINLTFLDLDPITNRIRFNVNVNSIADNFWRMLKTYDLQIELQNDYIGYVSTNGGLYFTPSGAITSGGTSPYDRVLNLTETNASGRAGAFEFMTLTFETFSTWSSGDYPLGNLRLVNFENATGQWAANKVFASSAIQQQTFTWNGVQSFTIAVDGTTLTIVPSGSWLSTNGTSWGYKINGGSTIVVGSSTITTATFGSPLNDGDIVSIVQPINGVELSETFVAIYQVDLTGITPVQSTGVIHRSCDGMDFNTNGQYLYSVNGFNGEFFVHPYTSGTLWDLLNSYTLTTSGTSGNTGLFTGRSDLCFANGDLYCIDTNNEIRKVADTTSPPIGDFSSFVITSEVSNFNAYASLSAFTSDGITFNNNGTKVFMSDGGATAGAPTVICFDLTTPYNVAEIQAGTAVLTTYSIGTDTDRLRSIRFSEDGLNMFLANENTRDIEHYRLSIAYDPSSITFSSICSTGGSNLRSIAVPKIPLAAGLSLYVVRQAGTSPSNMFEITLP